MAGYGDYEDADGQSANDDGLVLVITREILDISAICVAVGFGSRY